MKYNFLISNTTNSINWTKLEPNAPDFFLVKKDFSGGKKYLSGFSIEELMPFKSSGVKTHDDENLYDPKLQILTDKVSKKYTAFNEAFVNRYCYRPFDTGYIYYDTQLLGRAREKTIFHMKKANLGMVLVSQPQAANLEYFDCLFIANTITDTNMYRRGGPSVFPLYLYAQTSDQSTIDHSERIPNLNAAIIQQIAQKINLQFTPEKEQNTTTFAPIDLLDYIYAVLHSPTYRETYKEFLKIDFPRVPYPKDAATFWALVALGGQLRQAHLLESPAVDKPLTQYPEDGDNVVRKVKYEAGNVYINDTQYFANVPSLAWEFYIGGYQPAQKWLKDRKDRILDFEDVAHYRRIIAALIETDRLMGEVDKIGVV